MCTFLSLRNCAVSDMCGSTVLCVCICAVAEPCQVKWHCYVMAQRHLRALVSLAECRAEFDEVSYLLVAQCHIRAFVPLQNCAKCDVPFDEALQIHHCRACGRGFCESCSSHRRPVPERNWGMEPVRVCDVCYQSPPRRLSGTTTLLSTMACVFKGV